MKSIFITGVDTDIGKTYVSIGLCLKYESLGLKVGYFKPFQSGAYFVNNKLIAPDVAELSKFSKIPSRYSYLFEGEVSPHLASILNNVDVDMEKIKKDFENFSNHNDITVVEGAGGLYCPACKGKLFSDIVKYLKQEIIIVTTPKLGRLNHLLMTIECAKINEIPIKGIIVNKISKTPSLSERNFIKEFEMCSDVKIIGLLSESENPTKEKIISQFKDIEI